MSATVIKNHNIVEPIKAKTLEDISKEDYDKDKKPSWVNIVLSLFTTFTEGIQIRKKMLERFWDTE